jgi:hypothetical protein
MAINFTRQGIGGSIKLTNVGGNGNGILTRTNIPLVKNGLVLRLETADLSSYPGSGETWYDISNYSFINAGMQYNYIDYTPGNPGYFTLTTGSYYGETVPYWLADYSLDSVGGGGITIMSVVSISDFSIPSVLFGEYNPNPNLYDTCIGYKFTVGGGIDVPNSTSFFLGGSNVYTEPASIDIAGTTQLNTNQIYLLTCYYDRFNNTYGMYYNRAMGISVNDSSINVGSIDNFWPYSSVRYTIGAISDTSLISSAMNLYATFVYTKSLSILEIQQNYDRLKAIYGIP